MRVRVPIILDLETTRPAYRWRLVASIYESGHAVLEGTFVLVCVLIVCAMRTDDMVFAWLGVAATLITTVRLRDRRQFMRAWAARGADMCGTPEGWMIRHAIGGMATAAILGAQNIAVLLLTHDTQLAFLVLMVLAGWLASTSMRLAASPATVVGQMIFSLVPTVVCLLFVPNGLLKIAIPAAVLDILVLFRITRSLGELFVQNAQSEQRVETTNAALAEANAKLTRVTLIDGLTGLANRRAFDNALKAEWSRAARTAQPLALLMIDVDFFKRYNDHYGHLAGDDCLRSFARHAAANLFRPTDLLARYGGEEFVALLPATSADGAFGVAERLRAAIAAAHIAHDAAPLGRVSICIGVASLVPAHSDDEDALIRLADDALYAAKRQGRDRVHRAVGPMQ